MPSIKCDKCNLYNFDTETHCKRCGNPLNNYSPIVERRSYQHNFDRNHRFQSNQALLCVKCGGNQKISIQTFNKKYISPVASLGILLGILPYFIFRILLATNHQINAPFCEDCWRKFKNIEIHSALFNFAAAMLVIGGFLLGALFDYLLILEIGIGLAIPLFIFGRIYVYMVSPKFKKVTEKEVVIKAPTVGEIVFTR